MSQGPEKDAFKQLKPICVEILGLASNPEASRLPVLLENLHLKLVDLTSSAAEVTFPRSLIHYVFFPLSQLLRESAGGVKRLRDVVKERIFLCLSVLADHWWVAWTEAETSFEQTAQANGTTYQVFDQLLTLGAVTLGGSPGVPRAAKSVSPDDPVLLAVVQFLDNLLRVRLSTPPKMSSSKTGRDSDWEWDGISELPSLDDYETAFSTPSAPTPFQPKRIYPTKEHITHCQRDVSPRGAMSLTLSTLLEITSHAEASVALRVESLRVLRSLLETWISGSPDEVDSSHGSAEEQAAKRVTFFLPGIVSTLQRSLLGRQMSGRNGGHPHADICVAALTLLEVVLLICLSDRATANLRRTSVTSVPSGDRNQTSKVDVQPKTLESLMQHASVTDLSEESGPSVRAGPAQEEGGDGTDRSAGTANLWTPEWLHSTLQRVETVLESLSPLAKHSSPRVQRAIISLSFGLLRSAGYSVTCSDNIARAVEAGTPSRHATTILLSWLLDLAGDGASASVMASSQEALRNLLKEGEFELLLIRRRTLEEEAVTAFRKLAPSILSQREDAVLVFARRISTIVSICIGTSADPAPLGALDALVALLGPNGNVARWSATLLAGLKLLPKSDAGSEAEPRFSYVDTGTAKILRDMLQQMGRALASHAVRSSKSHMDSSPPLDSFYLLWHFINIANRDRSLRISKLNVEASERCTSALLVADDLLKGIGQVLKSTITSVLIGKEGKRARKVARRLCTDVIRTISQIWDADEEEASSGGLAEDDREGSEALVNSRPQENIEHVRGMGVLPLSYPDAAERSRIGPALNLDFVGPALLPGRDTSLTKLTSSNAMTIGTHTRWQIQASDSLLFSLLASSAGMLGADFRPAMLKNLYSLMCGLASPSPILRQGALESLARIADACGYATVQACVMDHADYVLGAASQRLLFGLSSELERTQANSGEGDVSDARAQNVELPLTSAQFSPLVMVQIISMLGPEAIPLVEDAIDEVLDALDRFHGYDELSSGLIAVLDGLVEVMMQVRDGDEAESGRLEPLGQPERGKDRQAFEEWFRGRRDVSSSEYGDAGQSSGEATTQPENDGSVPSDENVDPNTPPTRSQEVLVQILTKCVPFLSHAAPTLRARILALIRRGVRILAPMKRDADIMAVVNRAWPLVLARLGVPATTKRSAVGKWGLANVDMSAGGLSEQTPFVWAEAVALVQSIAKHLPDLMGKRIVEDAWPRFDRLLSSQLQSLQRPQAAKRIAQPTVSIGQNTSGPALAARLHDRAFTFFPDESVPSRVLIGVLSTLSTTVRHLGATLSDDDAWAMSTHQVLLNALDDRQTQPVRSAAIELFVALARRDANALWLVLHYADATTSGAPFLHQPYLSLEKARLSILDTQH